MYLKIAVWTGLGLFALLSAADWLLTYQILTAYPTAIEANPIAAICLKHSGWIGLAVYKAATVLVFVTGVYLLLNRRPSVAAGTVSVGCVALLAVTLYSHNLMATGHHGASFNPTALVFSEPSRDQNQDQDAVYTPHEYYPPLEYHPVKDISRGNTSGTRVARRTPNPDHTNTTTH